MLRAGDRGGDAPAVGPSVSDIESTAPWGFRELPWTRGGCFFPPVLWDTGLGTRDIPAGAPRDVPGGTGWLRGGSFSGRTGRIT